MTESLPPSAVAPDGVTRLLVDLASESLPGATRVLVVDDPDGALALAAARAGCEVEIWCDSLVHERAAGAACAQLPRVRVVDRPGASDLALVRLPKSLGALAEICDAIARAGCTGAIFAGRVKYMTPRQNAVIARYFEGVHATRGRFKSRGIVAGSPRGRLPVEGELWQVVDAQVAGLALQVHSRSGTFGAGKIDFGSAFLLENMGTFLLQQLPNRPLVALDMGCGNGIIAAFLASSSGNVSVTASDISRSAVTSANATFAANHLDSAVALRSDALDHAEPGSVDLVITNPPFHDGGAVDTAMSQRLFAGAGRALAPGGELWCVFNSMLRYRPLLTEAVGATTLIAQNRKFTVTRSVKSR
ncbi:methyltransferase [Micrococcales bacterium 31B]|nr:methyltransferase [Micrococcales bacterium 31B]